MIISARALHPTPKCAAGVHNRDLPEALEAPLFGVVSSRLHGGGAEYEKFSPPTPVGSSDYSILRRDRKTISGTP